MSDAKTKGQGERGSAGQHQGATMKNGWQTKNPGALPLRSANGAAPYQPGATPQENRTPQNSGLKARANPCAVVSGFQPSWISETVTQGVALGWRRAGALPLRRVCL